MPTVTKDPRSYVRPVPLPITPQKGIKIQARSAGFYNPTEPSRTEVRSANYTRRLNQLTQQGFRAANYKPYQGIGDPFYLDQKRIILHALGQLEDGQDLDSSSCSESSDDDEMLQQNAGKGHMTTANFMLRKARKGLNTLSKETGHGREMIRNVRLGHGLFQLLQRENEQRTEAKQRELQKKREQMWNEWQPPKSGSDTESDLSEDDDLLQEVDLKHYMISGSSTGLDRGAPTTSDVTLQPPTDEVTARSRLSQNASRLSQNPSQLSQSAEQMSGTFLTQGLDAKVAMESRSVVFRDIQSTPHDAAGTYADTLVTKSIATSVVPSSARSSRKKANQTRPFTPQHSNICAEYNMVPDKQALFRQLCALYWILEAMNINEQTQMSPIMTCWSFKDMGGIRSPFVPKPTKEKTDYKWKQFVNANTFRAHSKRRHSGARPALRSSLRRGSANQRLGSTSSTPYGSQSQLNMSAASSVQGGATSGGGATSARPGSSTRRLAERRAVTGDNESVSGIMEEDDIKDPQPPKPDTHPDSHDEASIEAAAAANIAPGNNTVAPGNHGNSSHDGSTRKSVDVVAMVTTRSRSGSSPQRRGNGPINKELRAQILDSINRSEEDPRLHRLANPTEKRSSTGLRAEYNVRPKSTEAVLHYQANLPSTRIGQLPGKLRREFDEVTEEKALVLHDTLDAIDRERMRKLRMMFVSVPTRTSLHKALEKMRTKSVTEEEQTDKRRRSSTHQQWYIDLCNSIPEDLKQEWHCEKILSKLSKYGMVEASKQSTYKFLRVLDGLRDFEICSPDICSAIEFCREKIVEMAVEEYEEWFTVNKPGITRPQTAPPAATAKTTAKDGQKLAITGKARGVSAPAGEGRGR